MILYKATDKCNFPQLIQRNFGGSSLVRYANGHYSGAVWFTKYNVNGNGNNSHWITSDNKFE